MNIVLIRHGMTISNSKGLYMGQTDEGLADEGREELHQFVKSNIYPKVEKVYSSPMKRCLQTAAIIYPEHQPVIIKDFREMSFGLYEGLTYDEIVSKPGFAGYSFDNPDYIFPEGEGISGFSERCRNAFLSLNLSSLKEENIAILAHGGVIMTLLSHLLEDKFFNFLTKNGRGFIISEKDGKYNYKNL